MKHQVDVYYAYCPKSLCSMKNYREYQKKLADKMLNYGLKRMFDIDATGMVVEKGKYGKPYLKDMEQCQYNISNTDGIVVCALSDMAVGVDTEKEKPFRSGILHKCTSATEIAYIMEPEVKNEQEKRFFQLWTLKESYIKMTGKGMRIPLTEVVFGFEKNGEIFCSKQGKFYQRRQGDYWISLCIKEDAEVNWYQFQG